MTVLPHWIAAVTRPESTTLAQGLWSQEAAAVGQYGWEWLSVAAPLLLLLAGTVGVLWAGRGASGGPVDRITSGLERLTGRAAWSVAGIGVSVVALGVAATGFYWDVAWHIDLGRDEHLLTPPHVAIMLGLALLAVAGAVSTVFATRSGADVGVRVPGYRIPRGALVLMVLGASGVTGFALDELWHASYGIDVTMWSPTHLLMIASASVSPLALWLLVAESGPGSTGRLDRALQVFLTGVLLTGLSTFQGEFDFGVPQFQQLYHPVLIAAATGFGLTFSRVVLGPGGAMVATSVFLGLRLLSMLRVGLVAGLVAPRFPLYLGAAMAVEAAFALTRGRPTIIRATAAGLGAGTVGLLAEGWWTGLVGHQPWSWMLFPRVLLATAVAVLAAVLGIAAARVVAGRHAGIPAWVSGIAGAGLVALLLVPLPRQGLDRDVVVHSTPAGTDHVVVTVEIDPALVEGADWFTILSWQGGSSMRTPLVELEPGRYRSAAPVPASGTWKSLLRLARGDVLAGAPIFMPADPQIATPEIPAVPTRTAPLDRDTRLMMPEAQDGPWWPATVISVAVLSLMASWVWLVVRGLVAVARRPCPRTCPKACPGTATGLPTRRGGPPRA